MSKRSTILRVIGTLLAFILLIYLLSQQGWEEISVAIQQIPLWRLALALCLMFVSRLAVTTRWYVLLHATELKISYWQSARITFAGLFVTNFLPTTIGGDVVRLAGTVQLHLDAAICAASLIVDRLVGLAGMAMAVPLGLPSLIGAQPTTFQIPYALPLFGMTSLGNWWDKTWENILRLIRQMIDAVSQWVKQPGSLLLSLVFSWLHMLCLFLILFILLEGVNEHVPIWSIAGLYSLVYLITLIPISINGYGLQEISMSFFFSRFAGVSLSSSLTVALLFRTLMMAASLPGVVFVPDILSSREPSVE